MGVDSLSRCSRFGAINWSPLSPSLGSTTVICSRALFRAADRSHRGSSSLARWVSSGSSDNRFTSPYEKHQSLPGRSIDGSLWNDGVMLLVGPPFCTSGWPSDMVGVGGITSCVSPLYPSIVGVRESICCVVLEHGMLPLSIEVVSSVVSLGGVALLLGNTSCSVEMVVVVVSRSGVILEVGAVSGIQGGGGGGGVAVGVSDMVCVCVGSRSSG